MKLIFIVFASIITISFYAKLTTCSSLRSKKPVVIAHRGASGYLPEHTFQAKVMAYVMGGDYLEQDLVLTKDNIPIVLHDIYLDDVTDVATSRFSNRTRKDGRYYAIDFTLSEIKELNVSERFKTTAPFDAYYPLRFPKWQSKFEISTFKEELELIKGLEKSLRQSANFNNRVVGIYPEIKEPEFHNKEGRTNFTQIVLQMLNEFNYTKSTDPIILQCFDPFELIKIRNSLKSNLTAVFLMDTVSDDPRINYTYWASEEGLRNISQYVQGIGPEKGQLIVLDSLSKKYLRPSELTINAKKLGLLIHPYTFRVDSLPPYVNNFDELLHIFIDEVKVDGVFSDFPDWTVEYLKKNNGERLSMKFNLTYLTIFFSIFKSLF